MSRQALAISHPVVREVIRLAAAEAPGVLRVGFARPPWRRLLGSPVGIRVRDGTVEVRVVVVARPGASLQALSADVRGAVGAAVRRLLGMELGTVTVVVDGIGS
jgi:uncharacterized alkaline shock family protein YloU